MRERSDGKIERAVLMIAALAAAALIVLAVVAPIGFTVMRQIRGPSFHRGETPHAAPQKIN